MDIRQIIINSELSIENSLQISSLLHAQLHIVYTKTDSIRLNICSDQTENQTQRWK